MDPDGGSTVYADAAATIEHERAQVEEASSLNGGVGGMVTPTPPSNRDRHPLEALTSEHGGSNEPLPSSAGISLLATNLDRQLANLTVSHRGAAHAQVNTNFGVNRENGIGANTALNTPNITDGERNIAVGDLLDIPGLYTVTSPARDVASAPGDLPANITGPSNVTGNAVNGVNGTGSIASVASSRTVPPAFSHIRSPEVPLFAYHPTQQPPLRTPDVGSVGIQPNLRPTVVRDNTTSGRGRDPDGSVGSAHGTTYYSVQSVRSRFEQADHEVSAVIGEINAQEAKVDEDVVSKISNSFDGSSGRSERKWQQIIGTKNMTILLELEDKPRNKMMEMLGLFAMAAESDDEIVQYATSKLQGTPLNLQPISSPIPDTPEMGFNEYQPSLTPEIASPPKKVAVPPSPAPFMDSEGKGATKVKSPKANVSVAAEKESEDAKQLGTIKEVDTIEDPKLEKSSVEASAETAEPEKTRDDLILKVLQQISSASTKDKQVERMKEAQNTQIWKSSADSVVPKLPKVLDDHAVGNWYEHILLNLRATPWAIDGASIYELRMEGVSPQKMTTEYQICNEQLAKHLYFRLQEANQTDLIDDLRDSISHADGVSLLDTIYESLLPHHAAQILQVLTDLGNVRHKNKETMSALHSRLNRIFKRLNKLGYTSINQLMVAFTQLAVFEGHYKEHAAVKNERVEVDHRQFDLKSYDNPRSFTDQMQKVFLNNQLLKPGRNEMESFSGSSTRAAGTARRAAGGGTISEANPETGLTSKPPATDRKMAYASTGDQLCLEVPTVFDVVNYMKWTNCPLCKIPKNFPR